MNGLLSSPAPFFPCRNSPKADGTPYATRQGLGWEQLCAREDVLGVDGPGPASPVKNDPGQQWGKSGAHNYMRRILCLLPFKPSVCSWKSRPSS